MRIGLSLSKCVSDLAEGRILDNEFLCIIAGTNASTPQQWGELIAGYASSYWHKNPEKAVEIVNRLLEQGRIVQPRTFGVPAPNIARGHWHEMSGHRSLPQLDLAPT